MAVARKLYLVFLLMAITDGTLSYYGKFCIEVDHKRIYKFYRTIRHILHVSNYKHNDDLKR